MNAPTTIEVPAKVPALTAGARPKAIVPVDIDQVWRFAQIVAKSGMAPKDMQKPEMITVAIMHGLEVGLTPLMALQRIAVINGRPSIWGDGAMGLVRASGLCEYVYEAVTGDGDNMVAVCRVKRKGEKEQIERTFSVADAKKAGLWGKSGPWQQYPKRMLQMRARAFALRDLFADVLGGLYIAEELEGDDAGPSMKDVSPRPEARAVEVPPLPQPVRQQQDDHQPEAGDEATSAPPKSTKPLPPPARKAPDPAPAPDGDGIPPFLKRACPPADQPEAFRDWIAERVKRAADTEALQTVWDSYVQSNIENEQIFPPDVEDLNGIFRSRRLELEAA